MSRVCYRQRRCMREAVWNVNFDMTRFEASTTDCAAGEGPAESRNRDVSTMGAIRTRLTCTILIFKRLSPKRSHAHANARSLVIPY